MQHLPGHFARACSHYGNGKIFETILCQSRIKHASGMFYTTTRTLCGTLGTHGRRESRSQRYRDAAWWRPAACATLRTQEGVADEEWRKISQKDIPLK